MRNRSMEEEGTLVPEDAPKPVGQTSPGDFTSDTYGLYFNCLITEKTTGLLSGYGVAICREEGDNNLLFQMKGSLHDSNVTVLEAELMALKRGLNEAVNLGIEHILIYCDNNQIFELVMGRSVLEQENIANLMNDVQDIRKQLTSSVPVLVTGNQTKFAYTIPTSMPMPRPDEKKTCGICFDDDIKAEFSNAICNHHQCCVECIKQHIEVKLNEGGVPRCPHYGCKSNLTLSSCVHLLTPKQREIWELRIKEDSIPVCDRFHCPNPRCWALMSKTQLLEYSEEDGVRRCCLKCRKHFCIICKVQWHSNLSCEEYETSSLKRTTTLRVQCRKCQHMIQLEKKPTSYEITCRCGYSFCYTCGAQWKEKGCLHKHKIDADGRKKLLLEIIFFYIIVFFSCLLISIWYNSNK